MHLKTSNSINQTAKRKVSMFKWQNKLNGMGHALDTSKQCSCAVIDVN
jgi:hypothetical protein